MDRPEKTDLKKGEEVVEGSDKRYFGTVFMTMFLFYAGLACFVGLRHLIIHGHWWLTCVGVGIFGLFMMYITWNDLRTSTYYTRDFLYTIDEKRIFDNGVFMRRGKQAYMLRKKFYTWDIDPEEFEKLPVRVYYNAFRKATDRKVNILAAQVLNINASQSLQVK